MNSPKEYYDRLIQEHGFLKASQEALAYMKEKYFKVDASPDLMESVKMFRQLIPGQMYTFMYEPVGKDNMEFFDRRPIVLSIRSFKAVSTGNQIEQALNLNFVPPEMRINILESLHRAAGSILDDNMSRLVASPRARLKSALPMDERVLWKLLDHTWDHVAKSGYRFALRSYIFSRLKSPRLITLDDWAETALLEPKDIMGESLSSIYRQYWNHRKKNPPRPKKR